VNTGAAVAMSADRTRALLPANVDIIRIANEALPAIVRPSLLFYYSIKK
jgi:hypothetical protein